MLPRACVKILREAGDVLEAKWEQKLMEFPAYMIEQPEYRLAGAEEAVRHAFGMIEQILQHHEPLAKDLAKRANDAYVRLQAWFDPRTRRPDGVAAAGGNARTDALLSEMAFSEPYVANRDRGIRRPARPSLG